MVCTRLYRKIFRFSKGKKIPEIKK